MAQYSRPDADISDGGFTPSAGSDLYACLDDNSDTDYISSQSAADDTCQVSAGSVTDPVSSSGHVLRARLRRSKAVSSYNATVVLKQGSTTIATLSVSGVDSSATTYEYTLSSAEANAITDYSDLNFTLTADYVSGSGCSLLCGWIELEVPDAAPTTYYATPSGAISPAGAAAKKTETSKAGAVGPAGALAKAITFVMSLAGDLWFGTGATPASLSGAVGFVGDLIKSVRHGVSGAVTPAGAAIKRTITSRAGAISPAGALAAVRTFLRTLSGEISPAGTLERGVSKLLDGAITGVGGLVKSVWRSLSGAIDPAATLAAVRTFLRTLSGEIGPAGTLKRDVSKLLDGAITGVGGLVKSVRRSLSGAIDPAATMAALRTILTSISGAIGPSGTLGRSIGKMTAGWIDQSGTALKATSRTLYGSLDAQGGLVKMALRWLAGALDFLGSIAKQTFIRPDLIAFDLDTSSLVTFDADMTGVAAFDLR